MLQPVPLRPAMPFHALPDMTAYTGSTTVPSTTGPVSSAAAVSTAPSLGQSAQDKTDTEELPLWVETKTAEGKVS